MKACGDSGPHRPPRAGRQAGGRVVVADVVAHGNAKLVERLGRRFAGFDPRELTSLLDGAGLQSVRLVELPKGASRGTESVPARRSRTGAIARLAPLVAVGVVPADGRARIRRTR